MLAVIRGTDAFSQMPAYCIHSAGERERDRDRDLDLDFWGDGLRFLCGDCDFDLECDLFTGDEPLGGLLDLLLDADLLLGDLLGDLRGDLRGDLERDLE